MDALLKRAREYEASTDCECEFLPDPNDPHEATPEDTWHFLRICQQCGGYWWGLHCPHDGHQNPCPWCEVRPTPMGW